MNHHRHTGWKQHHNPLQDELQQVFERFFGDADADSSSVVTAQWVRPAVMLERHARGEATLYPPTWITLHELSGQPDSAALFAVARVAGISRYETVARAGSGGPLLLWQGDGEYEDARPADEAGAAASRHRLDLATLPWVYTRSG